MDRVGSISSGAEDKIETRSLGKRPEVAVTREEGNTPVDTTLRNQRVAEASFAALCQHFCAQHSRPLPETGFDLNQRDFGERFRNA